MNSESENEEDDLFTLSNVHSDAQLEVENLSPSGGHTDTNLPPGLGDHNFNGKPPNDGGHEKEDGVSGGGGDRLERLRAELMQGLRERDSGCEDRGKGQLHTVLAGEEGGARMDEEQRGVAQRHAPGEDGGSRESDARELGGACGDGTRVHTVGEEGRAGEPRPDQWTSPDGDGGANITIAPPAYGDLYTDADDLARHMQSHSEEQQRGMQLPTLDLPDGTVFSRPPPPSSTTEEEEEEEVVFPGLFPLSCRCYYGDEDKMKELKERAELVLTQSVSMIHSSLGEF